MNPTDEQQTAIDLFNQGESLAIEAVAGSGKTTALEMIGQSTDRRGVYFTFSKAMATEAKERFPGNVKCSTAHALAFGAVGRDYKPRLGQKMRSFEVARALGTDAIRVNVGGQPRLIAQGLVATLAMRALSNFYMSADPTPTKRHVPKLLGLDDDSIEVLRLHVAEYLPRAWADVQSLRGRLPFTHDAYLKIWSLGEPEIKADFLLLDEAQDLNAVMLQVAEMQKNTQLILVGDQFQSIYQWRGAINAMRVADVAHRTYLTQSWRFGPAIADVANVVLARLASPVQVIGNPAIDSTVGPLDSPFAYLSRTNALAVQGAIRAINAGLRPAIVGGVAEVISFCYAADKMMAGQPTDHHELAAFEDWGAVLNYVQSGENDDADLTRMVNLVVEHGATRLAAILRNCEREDRADVLFSTAHKSKGRQFATVKLAEDFKDFDEMEDAELRLLYVATTRAQFGLQADLLTKAPAQ